MNHRLLFGVQEMAEIKTPPSNVTLICLIYEVLPDLCSVYLLQDAFDAMGYFQLALAAALEDRANPQALYVVYMKLAEIHGSHLPDTQLCQVYRERAQSLKRLLAGEDAAAAAAVGDEEETEQFECTESNLTSVPETVRSKDISRDTDTDNGDADENIKPHHTEGHFLDAPGSETETLASQSYSDSTFTESFDTAKEQISDSCSSTDTLQTDHKQTEDKDSLSAHSVRSHSPVNHMDAPDTDSHIENGQNGSNHKADARAECVHEDVLQSDSIGAETIEDKAAGVDNACDYTDEGKYSYRL